MSRISVQAPFPGVFYRRPSPEAAPFAEPGEPLSPESVIGLLEVMKQFAEITAGEQGSLVQFEVEDGAVVEAGQVIAVLEGGDA